MKIIQKKIKKELSEEITPIFDFDFTKSSLSAGEIDELIKTLSLNIIKTREILKETFDEYIITLISFDKIKNKIKFLKTKHDESFNDCSPVFSKKFKLISNIENNFNNDLEENLNSNNYINADPEGYFNKMSNYSQITEKRSKLTSNDTKTDNSFTMNHKENSSEPKSHLLNANYSSCHDHILNREHLENFQENKNEFKKFSKILPEDIKENQSFGKGFDLIKASDEDYDISENDDVFESFANKNCKKNATEKNSKELCWAINNKILKNKGEISPSNRVQSKIFNYKVDDYYISKDLDNEEGNLNNHDYNRERLNNNAYSENSDFGNVLQKKNNYDGNLDINSLYLDSIQEEEFLLNKSEHCSNSRKTPREIDNSNNYLTLRTNNSEMSKHIDKSEEEFKRNFPMKFYRHFQTENNYAITDSVNMKNDNNSTYKKTRNHGDSSHLYRNVTSQKPFIKNLTDLESINVCKTLYNFDHNNFSDTSNDLMYTDMPNYVSREKKIFDMTSEKSKYLNCKENDFYTYLDDDCSNEDGLYSNPNAVENINKNIINEQILRVDNIMSNNDRFNFLSPYRRERNAPIFNTGNKIRKMSNFDVEKNHTNPNSQYDKEDNENNENNTRKNRKTELNNTCPYSKDSYSIFDGHKNKNSCYDDNQPQKDKVKMEDSINNRNIIGKYYGEQFKEKPILQDSNNNGLFSSKNSNHLNISNYKNPHNCKNSKAFISKKKFCFQNHNSNRSINNSKSENPENSHIEIVKSSSNRVNKLILPKKNSGENLNQYSAFFNNSHLSKNSNPITEKIQNIKEDDIKFKHNKNKYEKSNLNVIKKHNENSIQNNFPCGNQENNSPNY